MDNFDVDNYLISNLNKNQKEMLNIGKQRGIEDPLMVEREYINNLKIKNAQSPLGAKQLEF